MHSSRLSSNLKQIEKDIIANSTALEDVIQRADLPFLGVLRTLRGMLTGDHTAADEDKIREALNFIQTLKVGSDNRLSTLFFPNEDFSDYLAEKKHPLLIVKNRELGAVVVLNDFQKKYLATIHSRLVHLFPHCHYTFELNGNGEVMNSAIAEWQSMQMQVNKHEAVINDFARAITIRGKYGDEFSCKTKNDNTKVSVESNVKSNIDCLVRDANGYPDKDKIKLMQWLIHNGGQDNTRFVDLYLGLGCFSPKNIKFCIGSVEKDTVVQNWDLNDAGKICFYYDVFINTLNLKNDPQAGSYVKLDNGLVEFREDLEEIKELQRQGNTLPLVRVRATVQLDMANGEVKPKVVEFIFDNYASSRLFLVRQDIAEQNNSDDQSSYQKLGR